MTQILDIIERDCAQTDARQGLTLYKHFCVHQSWPPDGKSRHSGGQGCRLFTPSGLPAALWWTSGGSAQRKPPSTLQPLVLGWKLALCRWSREWRFQISCWRPKPRSGTTGGTEVGQRTKEQAERWPAPSGPLETNLAAHPYATQWMRVGWPPCCGCPPEARCRAAGAMFVGYSYIGILEAKSLVVKYKHTNDTLLCSLTTNKN